MESHSALNGHNATVDVARFTVSDLKEEFDKELKKSNIETLTEKLGGISIRTNEQKDILKDLVFPGDANLVLPNSPSGFLKLSYAAENSTKQGHEEKLFHLKDKDLLEVTVKEGKKLSNAKECPVTQPTSAAHQ